MNIAIFPGSFAPFTIGHADIVRRGLQLFDRVVIAVGYNAQKAAAPPSAPAVQPAPPSAPAVPAAPSSALAVPAAPPPASAVQPAEACLSEIPAASLPSSLAQRTAAIERIYADEPRIKVVSYSDLTVDLAAREGARFLLRGVRSVKDFEYERDMAAVNRDLTTAATVPEASAEAPLETILLIADPRYAHISSSLVRELQAYGRDVTPYLP